MLTQGGQRRGVDFFCVVLGGAEVTQSSAQQRMQKITELMWLLCHWEVAIFDEEVMRRVGMPSAMVRALPALWFCDSREKYWVLTCQSPTHCEVRADLPAPLSFSYASCQWKGQPWRNGLSGIALIGLISASSGKQTNSGAREI